MNKTICLALAAAALSLCLHGCSRQRHDREAIATIGSYSLYRDDFISELSLYPPEYRQKVTKQQILDGIIQKKILLLEAQRRGLDRDPQFMKMVERFWEQSLLRSLLDMRSEEILSGIPETDKDRNAKAGEVLRAWVEELEKNTPVKVNDDALEKITIK
ncbi:MAG TPA: hypothetical protein PLV09_06265 [Candidatus Omnitrophota bacterium]|jgi:hypothetical protein|nr:hypothetical protein [Candidatus Omnitrophota bacterium]HOX09045.1 hypothetical protein [Candidatus Omnitrophota bacterium]HPN67009.1 hypothetical protein [Candidatus Omnitrophota bacterium]HRZ66862.1 hypothetical protein [Candidatus Omnitrophota bacterium]